MYRPPRSNEADLYTILLTNCLNYLASTCLKICIFGYFNLPGVNWDTGSYPISKPYNILWLFFFDNGLHQLVLEPIRGNNILDLVFVSDPLLIRDIRIRCPLANSDHNVNKLDKYISSMDDNSNTYYESYNDNHPTTDEFDNIFNNMCRLACT